MKIHRQTLAASLLILACVWIPIVYADSDAVILYPAFGTPQGAVIEGRVIEAHEAAALHADDGWWANLWRNTRLMFNSERTHVPIALSVAGRTVSLRSDAEGYFRHTMSAADKLSPGRYPLRGQIGNVVGDGVLLIVPAQNTIGLISDLDDTLVVSNVNSKKSLLANTFLKNPEQREAVACTADFIRSVAMRNPQPELAPLIYLSASPRQLHGNISSFLTHNRFPPGVLITKRVTNDQTSDPLADQFLYKTTKIKEIFERLPTVRFLLMGDDGERDPEIYRHMQAQYPDRIEKILIRRVHPDPKRLVYPEQLDLTRALAVNCAEAGKN